MPDVYNASIEIGGALSSQARSELARAIASDRPTIDYTTRISDIDIALVLIDEKIAAGETL